MKKIIAAITIAFVSQIAHAEIVGSWPAGGGKITVTPTAGPIVAGGFEFVAEPGILTQGSDPSPFGFFIPNGSFPGNVTFGSLGTPVTVDGPLELDVTVSASAIDSDVTAVWGNDPIPTSFPIAAIPEPASFSIAAIGLCAFLGFRQRRRV